MSRASSQVILTSLARSATTDSEIVENDQSPGGVDIIINFTVQSGVETITPQIQVPDADGNWIDFTNYGVINAIGTYQRMLSQGISNGLTGATQADVKLSCVPRKFRVRMTHSGAGAHTYSVTVLWC